jgi:hypothetical protein
MVAAFFLPWMDGSAELDQRTFSGFDFARLIRNFEITADSASSTGGIRATALAIYLMPALVINGAVVQGLERPLGWARIVSGIALASAGFYSLLILATVLFLSVVAINDFAHVIGPPEYGFGLCALASIKLVVLGIAGLRSTSASKPATERIGRSAEEILSGR